jgi:proline iminopeptidase
MCQDYLLPSLAKLQENYQVIFYDQRSCGRSTGEINSDTISIDNFVEDLETIRRYFGFSKISVLGHSWGGLLAMNYAIAHPEKVEQLILLSTAPYSSEEFSLALQEYNRRMAPYMPLLEKIKESSEFKKGDPVTVENYFLITFRTYCYDPQKVDLLNLKMDPQAAINGFKVDAVFQETFFAKPFDLSRELQNLKVPTLIIHGECDVIPFTIVEKLQTLIPHSQLICLKNCGHFPYVERPEEFFNALRLWRNLSRGSVPFRHDSEGNYEIKNACK